MAILADVLEGVNSISLFDACHLHDFIKALIKYMKMALLVCLNIR